MNPHIFREYDIRGVVGKDLTDETVATLARATGTFFRQNGASKVSLGRDARESSPRFRDIFIEGLNAVGCDVLDCGCVPTPVLYYTQFVEAVDAGVMITGSHNPPDNNGFKICLGKTTIFGDDIRKIQEIAFSGKFESGSGKSSEKDVLPDYLDYLAENIKLGDRKLKVVVDSGNGMGGVTGVPLFKRLGCEVIELFTEPDSQFPNHHPDPTVPENMRFAVEAVAKHGADLAIAFDGDGDRIGVVDENGRIIYGDELMIIYARSILETEKGATFIGEVKCSQRMYDDIEAHGGKAIMWKVGHSLIKSKLKETHAALAGEMSGHIFFAHRYFGYDDATYSGARLLEILSRTDKPVSALLDGLTESFSTPEIRTDCPDEKKFGIVQTLTDEFKQKFKVIDIDGARIINEHGWALIRVSNTQPVIVSRFEADSPEHLTELQSMVETRLSELINS